MWLSLLYQTFYGLRAFTQDRAKRLVPAFSQEIGEKDTNTGENLVSF